MSSLLSGLRVVEAATFIAGPAAGTIMGDYGAEVIHVEPPGIGDPHRYLYTLRPLPESTENYAWMLDSRNKKSLALNLKSPTGREALYKLIKTADVFITNYQPSVLQDLGIRYEDLQAVNSRLVYAHITGYGEAGPEAERPGYDATAWWARSGMMDLIRPRGGELSLSAPGMGDHPTSVAMFGAIMLGLYRRERTGQGGKVYTSLMANGVWSNSIMAQAALCDATFFERRTHAESLNPLLAVYQTRDERHFSLIMVKEAHEWDLFCGAIARPDLLNDPRFDTSPKRRVNAPALVKILDDIFATRTLTEWCEIFDHHRVTFGIVQKSEALPDDPQMVANGLFPPIADRPERRTVDSPINVEGIKKVAPHSAPALGQHTVEVLQNLGYSASEISVLLETGAAAK
jgi:crotonobetainyl-CoA:carnitine CoA-transferase CaiB-like acyl-CoA transferase